MHPAWRPTEASRQACLVALVPEWALPVFVGEFIGHFAPLDDEQTDAEWNQRWCKWVTRGWNDPDRRPKLPPQQKDRDAEREHQARLAARAEARKAARDAEVLAKYGPKAKTPAKAPERPADAPDPDRVRRLGDGIGRPS